MSNNNMGTIPGFQKPRGYAQAALTVAANLPFVGAQTDYPDRVTTALIRVEGAAIRYRDDGTDPTTAVGMILNVGDVFVYTCAMKNLRLISTSGTATLNVAYYE